MCHCLLAACHRRQNKPLAQVELKTAGDRLPIPLKDDEWVFSSFLGSTRHNTNPTFSLSHSSHAKTFPRSLPPQLAPHIQFVASPHMCNNLVRTTTCRQCLQLADRAQL